MSKFTRKSPKPQSEITDDIRVGHFKHPESKTKDRPGRFRTEKPKVAEYVAKTIIKNEMDTDKAVAEMRPQIENPITLKRLARELDKSPEVKAQIQTILEASGLDDDSQKVYVRKLWEWFSGENENLAMTAARLLGRAFIAEKTEATKPSTLAIVGFEEGIKAMGLNGENNSTPARAFAAVATAEPAKRKNDEESV